MSQKVFYPGRFVFKKKKELGLLNKKETVVLHRNITNLGFKSMFE